MEGFALETIDLPDGVPIHVRWWRPAKPRGAVLCFHGIQSHGGWYESSGAALAAAGLTVLMPDRRGSGLNGPPRGHLDSANQCFDDTYHLLDRLRAETDRDAAHVIGISWGGRQAVLLARRQPEHVHSLTLVAPGLFPKVDMTMTEKFRVAMSMVNARERLFDIPLCDARLFTTNPDQIRYVEHDELKLRRVSAGFLLASRRLDREIRTLSESPYRGPIHLILAGKDRIIDNERTRRWLRDLPSPDRRITDYPNASHTIEFEPDPKEFFDDLSGWIAKGSETSKSQNVEKSK